MNTTLKNHKLTATINHRGAELISLKDNDQRDYIWNGNPEFWGKHSPVLFPIVGTLKNNSFHYENQEYHLSRHGFARDMDFELVENTAEKAVFLLSHNSETLKNYPFEFQLQLIYTLEETKLSISYDLFNVGTNTMPFSIGAHPAFALPESFESYEIEFDQNEALQYHVLENNLISNETKKLNTQDKKLPLDYTLFEHDALIFKTISSKQLTILEHKKPILKVDYNGFPNLGIWTKNAAPFICIEPWYGYSDVVNSTNDLFQKEGVQILESKSRFQSTFSIEIL
ncbi:aldose 1-epimerase family protein [Flavobacterium sp. FPG59]|uniref:aldose 1-epimerase family protein n=1 Tax=Flavobacterium sp. FPG59 TaxID=1929267 RepID=UPI000A3728C1|nr:aldose 1-epimerase family protein [Flavobacterium sp. FPG59]OUD35455.1 aldose epimerase [Flavobacterium sp. FPG59]